MNIFIVPAAGGVFVARGNEETFKPMTAIEMMSLAERLIIAARYTIKAESIKEENETFSDAEAVHALR
jgi:hypothetical protein